MVYRICTTTDRRTGGSVQDSFAIIVALAFLLFAKDVAHDSASPFGTLSGFAGTVAGDCLCGRANHSGCACSVQSRIKPVDHFY